MNRFLVKFHNIAWLVMLFVIFQALSNVTASASEQASFYGIWCSASESKTEAYDYADWLSGYGFAARVFMTSDWSNLDPDPWYVVSAGMYSTESGAYAALPSVQQVVSDAYVEFSGYYQSGLDVDRSVLGKDTMSAYESSADPRKDITETVDCFVRSLFSETLGMCVKDSDYSTENFRKHLQELYTGEFSEKQKSMIAASNTDMEYTLDYYEVSFYETSSDRVKDTYFNLFGTQVEDLTLPEVCKMSGSSYYLNYARTPDGMIRYISYEMEDVCDVELLDFSRDDTGQMVFTKKYDYYSHWGFKETGQDPTVSLLASVCTIPNDASVYGYNLVRLEFQF